MYIAFPEGFKTEQGYSVGKLKKGLYGLKQQAAHNWCVALTGHILLGFDKRFQRSVTDPTVFYLKDTHLVVYLLVHIDDVLMASNSKKFLDKLTKSLDKAFGINHLGSLQHFLHIKITFEDKLIKMSQQRYIIELATKYGRYGYRRITALLRRAGWQVNPKRVRAHLASGGPEGAAAAA